MDVFVPLRKGLSVGSKVAGQCLHQGLAYCIKSYLNSSNIDALIDASLTKVKGLENVLYRTVYQKRGLLSPPEQCAT